MAEQQCGVPGCERPGTTGGDCFKHKFEGGVRINGVALFRHDRNLGVTQMSKAADMFEGVKENQGRKTRGSKDIQLVRGRRGAHERRVAGSWQKV